MVQWHVVDGSTGGGRIAEGGAEISDAAILALQPARTTALLLFVVATQVCACVCACVPVQAGATAALPHAYPPAVLCP